MPSTVASTAAASVGAAMPLDPAATVGKVTLAVRDLDTVARFYADTIGLELQDRSERSATLGAGGHSLVELLGEPDASPPPRRTTGLYHLAILVPDRRELAHALKRLIAARRRLVGAADHLVSEALYLEDPEGNGIEIYRDRPREEWRRDGDEITMATLPLDLQSVLDELDGDAVTPDHLPHGTRMGHVHLHVADLAAAERFYGDLLGFDVTARGYPGALFMSAGGYHHHLGLNTWAGEGAPPAPPGSTGLRGFEVLLPNEDELDRAVTRLRKGGAVVEPIDGGALTRDPSRNEAVLRVAE
jgi:catechol 2,3-dioxygenase